ncbi:MAG: hypothetical protein KAI72_06505 [Candidatus Pacebacteria bacterium]|nr:hypothetical protein [Candidatus Paceibacterota bacterium]
MTAIKTIIEAEGQAEEIVNKARELAQKNITDTKKKQAIILDKTDVELKKERSKQIQEQKVDLSALYKKMLNEGKIKTEDLKKAVSAKQGEARQFVLDSFVK